jgi:hypothetical protein
VGLARPSLSASSLTPSLRGPLASSFKMAVARSMDWMLVRRFSRASGFGIAELSSVV